MIYKYVSFCELWEWKSMLYGGQVIYHKEISLAVALGESFKRIKKVKQVCYIL